MSGPTAPTPVVKAGELAIKIEYYRRCVTMDNAVFEHEMEDTVEAAGRPFSVLGRSRSAYRNRWFLTTSSPLHVRSV